MTIKEAANKLAKLQKIREEMPKEQLKAGNGKRINRKITQLRDLINSGQKAIWDRNIGDYGM